MEASEDGDPYVGLDATRLRRHRFALEREVATDPRSRRESGGASTSAASATDAAVRQLSFLYGLLSRGSGGDKPDDGRVRPIDVEAKFFRLEALRGLVEGHARDAAALDATRVDLAGKLGLEAGCGRAGDREGGSATFATLAKVFGGDDLAAMRERLEVLRREAAYESCDVWSYGCVLSCLSTRSINPYHPMAPTRAVELVALLQLRPTVSSAASPLPSERRRHASIELGACAVPPRTQSRSVVSSTPSRMS